MSDYQRHWYLSLLAHAHYNDSRPGHVLNDPSVLWRIAGATTRRFFENHCGLVLACFDCTEDGMFLYHPRSIKVLEISWQPADNNGVKQVLESARYISISSTTVLDSLFESAYRFYPRHVGKRAAEKAFYRAAYRYSKTQKVSLENAAEFIVNRAEIFGKSPAGHRGVYTPHMATWLNSDRFLDDVREWNIGQEHAESKKQRIQRILGQPSRSQDHSSVGEF